MNIISRIKNFLASIAGTPAMATMNKSPILENSKAVAHFTPSTKSPKNTSTKAGTKIYKRTLSTISRYITRCVRVISKLFWSAVIFVVLAHFAPELREQLPSMYRLIDLLIAILEKIFETFWAIIG